MPLKFTKILQVYVGERGQGTVQVEQVRVLPSGEEEPPQTITYEQHDADTHCYWRPWISKEETKVLDKAWCAYWRGALLKFWQEADSKCEI